MDLCIVRVCQILLKIHFSWKLITGSEKWNHLTFWTWGIFHIFIWRTLTAIFFIFFKFQDPFLSPKKNLPITGFIVLKKTGLTHNFKTKIYFEIYASSGKKVWNCWHFALKAKFGNIFANISGLGAYISKSIFALKPWVQTINLIFWRTFFGLMRGSWSLKT